MKKEDEMATFTNDAQIVRENHGGSAPPKSRNKFHETLAEANESAEALRG